MKKIYILLICVGFAQLTFGQVITNYNAKWFFGINAGTTWQTTDVQNRNNVGWGLTLGKSFNYNAGSLISFDVRGRLMHGFWYGQDRKISDFQTPNSALSQGVTDYKNSLGFAVHNFQTENYMANLELVLHANRLRERTRWDAFIFGGIGMNWSQTYGDYLNTNSTTGAQTLYAFDPNFLGKNALKDLQDGVYETALDGSSQDSYGFNTSASLGFGLGYQIHRAVTIGIEHKTTFAGNDLFDGFASAGKYKQDIFHYTSAYIQFRLFGRYKEEEQVQNVNYPPIVNFTQPATPGREVANPNFIVQAAVQNVLSMNGISFMQNGQAVNFQFNPKSNLFSANVLLIPGENTFQLLGSNQYGQDVKTTTIIYNREVQNLPIVTFLNPSTNPLQVINPNYSVVGRVENVQTKGQVKVRVNASNIDNFSFDPNNGEVRFQTSLAPGTNNIEISGMNEAGSDQETTILIYDRQVTAQPPLVRFTDPNSSPLTTNATTYTIRGKVEFVSGQSGVQFTKNGVPVTNFNFNANSNDFSAVVSLSLGSNVFQLTGTNTDGTAAAQTELIFERAQQNPPIVTINNPTIDQSIVQVPNFQFSGNVLRVNTKNQVTFQFNGQTNNNFNYAQNGNVTANVTLNQGLNTFFLQGTNPDGTDSRQITVIYQPQQVVLQPVVFFNSPSNPGTSVQSPNYTVVGQILNVNGSQNVNFKHNGITRGNFSFSNNNFTTSVVLTPGTNTFELIGTNSAGTQSAQTTINFVERTKNAPIVTIINPNGPSVNVSNPTFQFTASILNVTSKSQIQYSLNGNTSNNYNLNSTTGVINSTISLNPGNNSILLQGTNVDGTDSKQVNIIYTPAQTINPPIVRFVQPSSSPTSVSNSSYAVEANITNVSSPSGVTVLLNGQNLGVFNYGNGNLTFNVNLVEGTNALSVTGTNGGGSDSKTTTIIYQPAAVVLAPVVAFINPPSSGLTVSADNYSVQGSVFNVSSKNDIQVKVNGTNFSQFTYSAATKLVNFTTTLNMGSNIIEIRGTNASGSDVKTTNIIYKKESTPPCNKPVVQHLGPNVSGKSPLSSADATFLYRITGASSVQFKLNGKVVNGTTTNNTQYAIPVKLNEGPNQFEVIASNNCGETVDALKFTYTEPAAPCLKPVISFLTPSTLSVTTDQSNYLITAKLSNINSANQIRVFLNNRTAQFSYNASILSIQSVLVNEFNKIKIIATNECGEETVEYSVTRINCDSPSGVLTFANIANNANTLATKVSLSYTLTEIKNPNEITVKLNGKDIVFNYNIASKILEIESDINIGFAQFITQLNNGCGTQTFTHTVTRLKSAARLSPTVNFTLPNTNPANVNGATYTLQFNTSNIVESGELILSVNGVKTNVVFNRTTNSGSAVVSLNAGANSIVLVATNQVGSATATTQIVNSGGRGVTQPDAGGKIAVPAPGTPRTPRRSGETVPPRKRN